MITRSISGISYTNGVMIVSFTNPAIPDESWNLALANSPVAVETAPYAGTETVPALVARGLQQVVVTFNDPSNPGKMFRVDVRDINNGLDYLTPQDLIDEIIANIPNGGGGGGGGGVTSVNGDTGPAVVLPLAGLKYNWSTATSGTPANGFVRGNNAAIGSITELVFAIVDDEGNDQLGAILSIAGYNNWPAASIGYGGIMVGGLYFLINGAPTFGAEMTVPVIYQDSSGSLPANNAPVAVVVVPQDRVATLVRTGVDGSDMNLAQFIVTGLTDSSGRLSADLSAYSVAEIVAVFGTMANQNAMVLGDILSATACRVAFSDNTNTAIQNEQASMLIYARF